MPGWRVGIGARIRVGAGVGFKVRVTILGVRVGVRLHARLQVRLELGVSVSARTEGRVKAWVTTSSSANLEGGATSSSSGYEASLAAWRVCTRST